MGKESTYNERDARDLGSIPGPGRSPGGGHGHPLQYSCLENPQGQRSLAGYSPWDHKEPDTTGVTVHTHKTKISKSGNKKKDKRGSCCQKVKVEDSYCFQIQNRPLSQGQPSSSGEPGEMQTCSSGWTQPSLDVSGVAVGSVTCFDSCLSAAVWPLRAPEPDWAQGPGLGRDTWPWAPPSSEHQPGRGVGGGEALLRLPPTRSICLLLQQMRLHGSHALICIYSEHIPSPACPSCCVSRSQSRRNRLCIEFPPQAGAYNSPPGLAQAVHTRTPSWCPPGRVSGSPQLAGLECLVQRCLGERKNVKQRGSPPQRRAGRRGASRDSEDQPGQQPSPDPLI